ncbi:MAG: aspartyl protease family protein [Bacteroidota bacterium]
MTIFSSAKSFKLSALLFLLVFHLSCSGQDVTSSIKIDGTRTSIPFILHDNRIFLKTVIGKKSFHFILDTGGGIVVDTDAADSLQLPKIRQGDIAGTGENPVPLYRTFVDTISIGGLQIINKEAMVISLKEIKNALQLDFLDGIVGYEVFQRFITEINFADSIVTFIEKETFHIPDSYYAIPFRLLNNRIPVIKVNIDGTDADFIVDTGGRSNLTLFSKFSDENNFRNRYILSDTVMTGYGLGGPINGQQLKIRNVKLNESLTVNDVTARIPTTRSGAFNRTDSIKGSAGNGLLKNFNRIIFDYFNKKLYIER